jgi:hypothetical protein
MAYERKPGTGALFQNNRKKSEKSPDWTGTLLIAETVEAGTEMKISAWTKQSSKGALISLVQDTWKPDPNYRSNANPVASKPVGFDDAFDDDSVPF